MVDAGLKRTRAYLAYLAIGIAIATLIFVGHFVPWTGFRDKSLWDWMELLVVPLVLAAAALLFNRSEANRGRKLAAGRAETERALERDRAQEAAMESYLDRMSELLLDRHLGSPRSEGPDQGASDADRTRVVEIARTRTLTVWRRMDGRRKRLILQFLFDAGLIGRVQMGTDEVAEVDDVEALDIAGRRVPPVISLRDAPLGEVNLEGVVMTGIDLAAADMSGARLGAASLVAACLWETVLRKADLASCNLSYADLNDADLSGADMSYGELFRAGLGRANLAGTSLRYANLREAILCQANLEGADLTGADLTGADLASANLSGATLSSATLEGTNLEGANLN